MRKKKIMQQLGADGVGTFKEEDGNKDQVEAAMERRNVMKKYAKENKKVNFATNKEIEDILREEESDEDEEFKEGDYQDLIEVKEEKKDPNFVIPKVDAKTLKQIKIMEKKEVELVEKLKSMKPTEGVKMVEYNEWGLPKDGTDYGTLFRFDETLPSDIIVKPPPEYKYPHLTVDEDKEYKDLTEEEKEVRDCLENDKDEEGEELEDDFVLKANGGVPALMPSNKKGPVPKPIAPHPHILAEEDEEKELEDAMEEYDEESDEEIKIDGKLTKEQLDRVLEQYMQGEKAAMKLEKISDKKEEEDKKKAEEEEAEEETPEEKKRFVGTNAFFHHDSKNDGTG